MRSLSKSLGMGYRNALSFRAEHALDALRYRPEFRLLMMDLTKPTDPFAR